MGWIKDYLNGNEYHLYRTKRNIITKRSKFQNIKIIETYEYGRCLFLDHKIQLSERDEYIYHELLVHPSMVSHKNPARVLIIGGGDGCILREVLKYKSVNEVVIIEIDKEVVEISRKYLSKLNSKSFNDKRVKIKYADGKKYIEESNEKFDIIFVDLSEPIKDSSSIALFTKEFYESISKRLKMDGVLALQTISPVFAYRRIHIAIYNTLCYVFPIVKLYYGYVPSFSMQWGFAIVSKRCNPEKLTTKDINKRLFKRKITGLKYYSGDLHEGLFILSKDLKEDIKSDRTIITNKNPLYI